MFMMLIFGKISLKRIEEPRRDRAGIGSSLILFVEIYGLGGRGVVWWKIKIYESTQSYYNSFQNYCFMCLRVFNV